MSELPSFNFFSDLDEEFKCDGSVGGSPLDSEYDFTFNRDIIPVCNDNYEPSVNLFQDNFLPSDLFNLTEKSNFSSDSHFNLPFDENSLPSSFVKDLGDWSNCENYLEPDTDIESFSKEFVPLESFEQLHKENSEKIHKDFPESSNFVEDEKVSTTKRPVTVILKKIKGTSNNNFNMVAPLSIPKTTYTLVHVPRENTSTTLPEKVSVLNLSSNTIPSKKKNPTFSIIKSEKDLKKIELSPVSTNEEINNNFEEKFSTKLSQKNNYNSEVLDYDELPFTSLKRKYPSLSKPKPLKKKAYELSPLPDPTLERCRRNAINAKKNRDIKKQKMVKLEAEIEQERQEKLKLASENETLKQMNEELKAKVNLLVNALESSSEPTFDIKYNQRLQEFLDESNASRTLDQRKTVLKNKNAS